MTIPGKKIVRGTMQSSRRQRTAPRESERATRRYATAVEFAMEAYAAVSHGGRLLKVNAAMCALTGYSRTELLRLAIADLEAMKTTAEVTAHATRIVNSGLDNFESRWRRRDGTIIDVAVAVTHVTGGGGEFFWFVRDVTGQKRVVRSARNLTRVVEQSPSLIIITDTRGDIEYVNPMFTQVTGYTLAEVIGKNPRMLRSGNTSREEYRGLWDAVTSGGTWRGEFCNRKKNGDLYWEDASISGVQDETGAITNFVAVKLDITARKQMQVELETYFRFFSVALDPMCIVGFDGYFRKVNPALTRLLGYSESELLATPFMEFIFSDDRQRSQEAIERQLQGSTTVDFENRYVRKDGAILHLSWTAFTDQQRGLVYGTARDVSERKRTEAALKRSADALRAAYRRLAHAQESERRRLAAELHDQVGQNLSALHLNLTVINGDISGESRAKASGRLDDAVALTRQVSQQIRDLMGELRPPMLDDYGLFATLRWMAHQAGQRSGITCVLDCEEPAERLPNEIESALLRISQEALTNAVKYSKAGWISIALTPTPGQIRLEIVDDGSGFDIAAFANNPQPTWGIMNMRERAESLGGRVDIESAPGKGTRVVVEVPTA